MHPDCLRPRPHSLLPCRAPFLRKALPPLGRTPFSSYIQNHWQSNLYHLTILTRPLNGRSRLSLPRLSPSSRPALLPGCRPRQASKGLQTHEGSYYRHPPRCLMQDQLSLGRSPPVRKVLFPLLPAAYQPPDPRHPLNCHYLTAHCLQHCLRHRRRLQARTP